MGQIMPKEGEPEAVEGDQYLLVNFMCQCSASGDRFKWPKKMDVLNVLKDDVLLTCEPPIPSQGSSSSRSTTFSLDKAEIRKAKKLFLQHQAYYPTKISVTISCRKPGTMIVWMRWMGVGWSWDMIRRHISYGW